jgi:ribosomal protein L11 methyltransferase
MRAFPALDLIWLLKAEDSADQLLALIDDFEPMALEELDGGVRVFFSSPEARDRAADGVRASTLEISVTSVDVPDEGWAEKSQASLQPVHLGKFLVTPPWYADEFRGKNVHMIVIQPSMGFGTGHHPTTRRCLSLLERADVRGKRIVDVGTGSGVLALAAEALGAAQAVGIDVDPDALISARENLELNQSSHVMLRQADLSQTSSLGLFDGLLANLTGAMLIKDAAVLAELVAANGWLILSGFQNDEEDAVIAALIDAGCVPIEGEEEDTWIGLKFAKQVTSPTTSTAH